MPRFPLRNFRRKSSGNALDLTGAPGAGESPAISSFRVLEREDKPAFDGGDRLAKRLSSRQVTPNYGQPERTKSADNLNPSANRDSAATTRSGSSSRYDTSSSNGRYSSISTVPSSFDAEPEYEELYSASKTPDADNVPPMAIAEEPPTTFASRVGRGMPFGIRTKKPGTPSSVPPTSASQPQSPVQGFDVRGRSTTASTYASTYASTAKPPQLDAFVSDFGGEFDNMFKGLSEPRRRVAEQGPPSPSLDSADISISSTAVQSRFPEPAYPPRATSRPGRTPSPANLVPQYPNQQYNDLTYPPRATSRPGRTPSPANLEPVRTPMTRRFSWGSHTSNDQLMSNPPSNLGSPLSETFSVSGQPSPVPGFSAVRGYQQVPDRYMSPDLPQEQRGSFGSNAGLLSSGDALRKVSIPSTEEPAYDSDAQRSAKAVWRSDLRKPTEEVSKSISSLPDVEERSSSPQTANGRGQVRQSLPASASRANMGLDSPIATPRSIKRDPDIGNDSSFDDSPVGPVSKAINPGKQRKQEPETPRKMTRSQFEQMKKEGRFRTTQPDDAKSEDSDDGDGELDGEDEAERHRELARQRRKQEATMAVYRQQMRKVTGGQLSGLPSQRSGFAPSPSALNLGEDPAIGNDEDDEDVPLGILQAHGFPSKNRPPTRAESASPGYLDMANPNMPEFARRLPVDPYFGAGLVSPANRESLAFSNRTPPVYGGGSPPPQAMQHGGLVGVIAGEERARAARRGSPNPGTGFYDPAPLHAMPQIPRANSMGNFVLPMGGYPAMSPMYSPDPAQMAQQLQMQQLMQMQQQMYHQMMAMQVPIQGLPMPGPGYGLQQSTSMDSLPGQGYHPAALAGSTRPMSGISQAPSIGNQGRATSMLNLHSQWNEQAQARSNTMGSNLHTKASKYAGSVYGGQGYTPSIAPSERSNIGMPSRYRPVSTIDGGMPYEPTTPFFTTAKTPPLGVSSGNVTKAPKSTIRVLDKQKGTPRAPVRNMLAEEDDDEEGWAEMGRKREEMRLKRQSKVLVTAEPALADIYHSFD